MNSEDKIYSKIKSASHKGKKDFPGMDKVWNRVEEKLDNTIVVKKKNTWQKLAIAATVLLSFSIIYQFVANDDQVNSNPNTENPIIVSNDSVEKIMDKAKEVVVENNTTTKSPNKINPYYNSGVASGKASGESSFYPEAITSSEVIDDDAAKMEMREDNSALEEKGIISNELNKNSNTENEVSFRNSAFNTSSSNNSYLAPNKKYDATAKEVKSKYKPAKSKTAETAPVQQNKDLIVIDGVAMDKGHNAEKELKEISTEEIADITYLPNPLYIINGIEYTEESLFGKNPTSPYAPLDKQKITATNILQPADATKIYGKKGKSGIVIITTKDGKPADK